MKTLRLILFFMVLCNLNFAQNYTMPHENEEHEGTWLQWPHQYEYGTAYRNSLDATWVAMTAALVDGEKVHIIAYNNTEKNRIINLLNVAGVSLTNVDFYIFETNDVWVRDNGPIFVRDGAGNVKIEDWGFNGWGGKYNYDLCDPIPSSIGSAINVPVVDLNSVMVNEGGAVELDGNGVFLACKSSIISQSPSNSVRNPGMTQAQAETIFSQYLGVSKFIWLEGNVGEPLDVTDFHIDGFAKFVDGNTLITMNNTDLTLWGASPVDINTLYSASNIDNVPYEKVYVPLTQNNVSTTANVDLGFKGSYVNFYVANGVVLVPNYNDANDEVANSIIQAQYPGRTVIGIDVRNLYENGGMVHCVTQQQPKASSSTGSIQQNKASELGLTVCPNPFSSETVLKFSKEIQNAVIILTDCYGHIVKQMEISNSNSYVLERGDLEGGIYFVKMEQDGAIISSAKVILTN